MTSLKKDLEIWSDTLLEFHLPRWEELPSFDLYLDQVITLIEGYVHSLFDDKEDTILTSAMINNYVKLKLIPKAEKKRYNKIHLAYLIAITLLKQVLTITEVKEGIEYQSNINGLKEAFNLFCEEQEAAMKAVAIHLKNGEGTLMLEGITLQNTAIKMATMSFAGKLVAEKMVHLQNCYHQKEEK
ncbi:DUF1836 domain-containing protein [Amedibacillus sp. YH-ame6]